MMLIGFAGLGFARAPASSKASRAPVFADFSPFIGQPFEMIQLFH
jgi:hypothetical protein